MRRMTVAMLLLATLAGTAHAQRLGRANRGTAPAGLMINVHAVGMPGFSIDGPDVDEPINGSMGPGMGAQIGYAFSPRYSVYAGLDSLGSAPRRKMAAATGGSTCSSSEVG